MSLLYGKESFVANFRLQTDVITVKANQTFPVWLTALTICLWFNPTGQRDADRALFTYLPEDTSIDGVYVSLLPKFISFSVNNDFIVASVMVSTSYHLIS